MDLLQKNNNVNVFIGFKIAEYYPDRIAYMAVQNDLNNNDMWSAGIFKIENNHLGDMIYCFDNFPYETEGQALQGIKDYVKKVMEEVKLISN